MDYALGVLESISQTCLGKLPPPITIVLPSAPRVAHFSLPVVVYRISYSIYRIPVASSCKNGREGLDSPRWHPELVLTLTIFEMSINAR